MNQAIKSIKCFTGDSHSITGDSKSCTGETSGPERTNINIASVVVTNIFVEGGGRYANGDFVVAFCDALIAIAKCHDFHETTFRVLLYLMGKTTKQLCFGVTLADIVKELSISKASARRAVELMIQMHIICQTQDGGANLYRLTDKLMNPRVSFYGNSKCLNKRDLPPVVDVNGKRILPAMGKIQSEFVNFFDNVDPETGEIINNQ